MISWFEKHSKLSLIITLFIAVTIFYLSSLRFEGTAVTTISSIFYHFFAFFFLALFLQITLLKGKEEYLFLGFAIAIAIIYGIFDEIHQFFVPGRVCSLFDVGVNTTGILISSMIYFTSIRFRVKN